MKTFLIPTSFEGDTTRAMEIALDMFSSPDDRIVLLSASHISDSITDLLFLSNPIDPEKKQRTIDHWANLKRQRNAAGALATHHQYGMSRPIFDTILERFDVSMSIVPESFQQSKQHIHRFVLKLLHKSHCPMMLLPGRLSVKGLQRALYLDESPATNTAKVQGYPFHVIHKSMVSDAEYPSIKAIVDSMSIDLIVTGKRVEGTTDSVDHEVKTFGLPVLTI